MAGSMKYFAYEAGNGNTYAIWMDESNGEHVGNADVTALNANADALPRNIRPRHVVYRSNDGRYQRKIAVTDPLKGIDDLPATLTVTPAGGGADVTLNLAYYQSERIVRVVRAADTGLNDGDDT